MKMSVASRLALASAAAVFIAACSTAEGPSAPMSAPDSPVFVGVPGVTVGGVVTACIDGTSPATTYSFSTSTANAQAGDVTTSPAGVTVPTPQCADVLVRTGAVNPTWATATVTASITGSPAGTWSWTCVSEDGTGLGCPLGTPVGGSGGTSTTGTGNVAQGAENSGHGTTITFHFEPDVITGAGCTYTQGWWKNKFGGPVSAAYDFDGGTNNGLTVLKTAPKGNPYYILAHQYIAATLNVAGGASMDDGGAGTADDVLTAYNAATTYFGLASAADPLAGGAYTKEQITALAAILDAYNNGLLGPGHCDELAPIGSGSH